MQIALRKLYNLQSRKVKVHTAKKRMNRQKERSRRQKAWQYGQYGLYGKCLAYMGYYTRGTCTCLKQRDVQTGATLKVDCTEVSGSRESYCELNAWLTIDIGKKL